MTVEENLKKEAFYALVKESSEGTTKKAGLLLKEALFLLLKTKSLENDKDNEITK
jgi:hypothetical protein